MVRAVRRRAFFWLVGVAIGGPTSGCSLISGLETYSAVGDADAGAPSAHSGMPTTAMTASGQAIDSPDATLERDVSPSTSETDEGGAPADAEIAARDGATDMDGAAPVDRGDGAPAANDGGKPNDGGGPADSDGGCILVTHSNGIEGGVPYTDCAPLDTRDDTEAAKACASANVGSCSKNTLLCGSRGPVECTQKAATCHCWSYSGAGAGHVSTGLGIVCACPGTSDPQWH
jgi:hypothetical protein